jgi:large subunit ribosomal protein L15
MYHQLAEAGRYRKIRRRGRGISAGLGKTGGRGTKGQNSRSGGRRRPAFEGGQTPLHMRLPKLSGFKSHRQGCAVLKTSQIDRLKAGTVTNQSLYESGLLDNPRQPVKLIYDQDLNKIYRLQLQSCSQNAKLAIEKAGGIVEKTDVRTAQVKSERSQETKE